MLLSASPSKRRAPKRHHRRPWATIGLAGILLAALAAQAGPPAEPARTDASACLKPSGDWDAACLRRRYAGPPAHWPAPQIDAGLAWTEMGPLPPLPAQPEPLVALGRKLFFDPRLSNKGQVACASCHMPDKAFSDGRILAVGEDRLQGRRRSPTLFAAPFAPRLFWDGRAASLEQQVLMPVADVREMNHALPSALARLATLQDYQAPVQAAFDRRPFGERELAAALAAFVRTIRPTTTAFDRFVAGESTALNDRELLGLHLFRTKARCMNCHHGPLLTDHDFHDLGLSLYGRRNQDLGRFEVTREPVDLGAFRTPSLRNVSKTGPLLHNGSVPDLERLVILYNSGMGSVVGEADDPYVPKKSPHIRALDLSKDERAALVAWLKAL